MSPLFVALCCLVASATAASYDCLNGGTLVVVNTTTQAITQPLNDTQTRGYPIVFGAFHYIVIAGGQSEIYQTATTQYYDQVSLFNIETATASSIGTMAVKRSFGSYPTGPSGIVNEVSGTMLIAGGKNKNGISRIVDTWNFFTGIWSSTLLSLPVIFGPTECFLVNGRFYILLTQQKTMDMFNGVTGKWSGSKGVGYPPAAGLETFQHGAVVGDSIYLTPGVDQQPITALVVYNTTSNSTRVISVPFPAGFIWDFTMLSYSNRLAFVYQDVNNQDIWRGFTYDVVANTTIASAALIPNWSDGALLMSTTSGKTKGLYFVQDGTLTPRMDQYVALLASFVPMGDLFVPYRYPGVAYNSKLGIFALVDGFAGVYDAEDSYMTNAISLYQESDMTLVTSIFVNQTTCVCPPGYTGFLCGARSASTPAAAPSLVLVFVSVLVVARSLL